MLPAQTEWLEQRCDEVNATLEPLKSFVLPGRHRRRLAPPRLPDRVPAGGAARDRLWRGRGPEVVRYLNRLSDLLFILSRGANGEDEPLWEPGRYR